MHTDTITLSYTVADQEVGNEVAKKLYQAAKGFTDTARVRVMHRVYNVDGTDSLEQDTEQFSVEQEEQPDDRVYIEDVVGLDRDLTVIKNRIARLEKKLEPFEEGEAEISKKATELIDKMR